MEANGTTNLSSVVYYWERDAEDFLFRYVAPFILAIGTIGNLICICVLRFSLLRRSSQSLILTILAFIDIGVLHTGLLRHTIKYSNHFDIRTHSSFSCKAHYFFTYTFQHLSSWTIVLITVERMLSLWIPFRIKAVCSMRRVSFTWLIMAVTVVSVNLHWLVLTDLRFDDKKQAMKCKYSSKYDFVFTHVLPWFDFCLLSLIPLSIILPSNCLIMIKVYLMRRARHTQLASHQHRRHQDLTSLNVMLLVMSFTFVVTTTPMVIYFIGINQNYWKKELRSEKAKTFLAFAICNMLYYVNSAFNFFLYCVSGSHFREALLRFCKCAWSSSVKPNANLRQMPTRMVPRLLKSSRTSTEI